MLARSALVLFVACSQPAPRMVDRPPVHDAAPAGLAKAECLAVIDHIFELTAAAHESELNRTGDSEYAPSAETRQALREQLQHDFQKRCHEMSRATASCVLAADGLPKVETCVAATADASHTQ